MKNKSLLTAATILLLPTLAFARQKDSTQVQFDNSVSIAGTELAPGDYKVTWQGNGSDVTVSFMDGRKIVATAPARLVNEPASQPGAVEVQEGTGKTEILQAVDLKGEALQFGGTVSSAGN